MIRLLFALLLFPIPGWSDVVSIRSGEHETFSRLVLSIPDGIDWAVNQTDSGARLVLDGHTDGFDVTQVFERIPRDRLAELEQVAQDTLALQFSCKCSVDTFLWRSDRLVLDISETVETSDVTETVAMMVPQVDAAMLASEMEKNQAGLPDITELTNGLSLARFNAASPAGNTQVRVAAPLPEGDTHLSEAALLEGIARAASQGFLNPNLQNLPAEPSSPAPEPASETMPTTAPDVYVDQSQPGVDITTALDQSLSGLGDLLRGSMEQRCLPADLFEISEWGDDSGFHEQVAKLSEALAGEFGEEPIDAETDLARLYLHFGFGSEALAALSITETASQSRQVLYELALLFDDTQSAFPLLSSQRNCETGGALWAFLAVPMVPEAEALVNGITRAFFELPQPLRGYIAPKLSQAFLSVDMPETADLVLRATNNNDAEHDPEVQTARAFIAEQNDDPDEAIFLLSEQANDTARLSPEAAIRLVTLTLEQGGTPSEADLVLLSALAKEFSAEVISDQIEVTEAMGWAARGEYMRALEIIAGRMDEDAESTREAVYMQLTERGSSNVFLEMAINNRPDDLSSATENAMARRLIDLGFPDQALAMMTGAVARAQASERRYLRAEAALEMADYSQAIDALQGMNDQRSRNLRAAAYSGFGDFRNAIESLEADEAGSTPELQFRAGAWDRLTLENDVVLSDFARTVVADIDPEAAVTLEDRRSLLAQSQESRRAVENLLLRFDGTAAPIEQP